MSWYLVLSVGIEGAPPCGGLNRNVHVGMGARVRTVQNRPSRGAATRVRGVAGAGGGCAGCGGIGADLKTKVPAGVGVLGGTSAPNRQR